MGKKENQRIALTKRLLQEGLLRLLKEKDLDKISVTELCREAGINRATFYNHYTAPQELLADLEQTMSNEMTQLFATPCTEEEVTAQLEAICTYLKDHAAQILVLSKCHADDDLAEVFSHLEHRYAGSTITGKPTDLDPDSIHLVSTFIHTGCYHLIREWLARDIQKSPREVAELLRTIINKDYQ